MGRKTEIDSREYDHDKPPLNINDLGDTTIEPVETLRVPDIELEAFMNEHVRIFVHESNDENAAKVEYLAVEGRRQFVVRGESQVIRRKYVERLARAKKTTFSQDLGPRDESMNTVRPHSALMIPFSVEDDTPRGREWFKSIMREAA